MIGAIVYISSLNCFFLNFLLLLIRFWQPIKSRSSNERKPIYGRTYSHTNEASSIPTTDGQTDRQKREIYGSRKRRRRSKMTNCKSFSGCLSCNKLLSAFGPLLSPALQSLFLIAIYLSWCIMYFSYMIYILLLLSFSFKIKAHQKKRVLLIAPTISPFYLLFLKKRVSG